MFHESRHSGGPAALPGAEHAGFITSLCTYYMLERGSEASQQPPFIKHSLEVGDEARSKAVGGGLCNAASKAVIRTSHVAHGRHAARLRAPIGADHSPPPSFPAAGSRELGRAVGPPSPVALRQLRPVWEIDAHRSLGRLESLFGAGGRPPGGAAHINRPLEMRKGQR